MSDTEAILAAIAQMQHVVDGKQWERLNDVYTPDGVFVLSSGASYQGLEEIRDLMLSFKHPLVHYTTNQLVNIDESGTSATVASTVLGITEDGEFLIGSYEDELRKEEAWMVSKRVCALHARLATGRPAVILGSQEDS